VTSSKTSAVESFSLVAGGPMFRLLRLLRASSPSLEYLPRRMLGSALIAWAPLLVFAALEGKAFGDDTALPLLHDLETGLRFLVALPILFWAEVASHRQLGKVVAQFRAQQMIPQPQHERFDAALRSAARLRDSTLAELVLAAVVFGVGVDADWHKYTGVSVATWYGTPAASGPTLSMAGMWLVGVSLPLLHFVLLRWYYRLCIWGRLLFQISRIDLALIPTHPDRTGGLGFMSLSVNCFVPIALAHGVLLAGWVGDRIFTFGAALMDFKIEIAVLVVLVEVLIIGPLLIFVPMLGSAQWLGRWEYGVLAERYVRLFDHKWLRGGAAADEPLLGSADIQSLADLSNSYDAIRTMRLTPFTAGSVIVIAAAALAPILPLVLTMMNAEELMKKLFAILL
jgi:hypothetical protein